MRCSFTLEFLTVRQGLSLPIPGAGIKGVSPHAPLISFLFSETGSHVTQAAFRYPRMVSNSSSSFCFFYLSCSSPSFLLSPSLMPGTGPLYVLGSALQLLPCSFNLYVSRCLGTSRYLIQSQLEKQMKGKAKVLSLFVLSLFEVKHFPIPQLVNFDFHITS